MGILGPKLPLLIKEIRSLKPATYIEIGCYRCETMAKIRMEGVKRIIGFDLFEEAAYKVGDIRETGTGIEDMPLEGPPITEAEAKARGFEVYKGDTRNTLAMLPDLSIKEPAMVFLDGGHSYETVSSDWLAVSNFLPGATVIFDDISYPGVAEVLRGIPMHRKTFLGYYLMKVEPDK